MTCRVRSLAALVEISKLGEVALGVQVRLWPREAGRKRQPQVDARAAAGAAAAFDSAAVPDGVPGHGGQAKTEARRDLVAETGARVFDREQSRALLPANLDRH